MAESTTSTAGSGMTCDGPAAVGWTDDNLSGFRAADDQMRGVHQDALSDLASTGRQVSAPTRSANGSHLRPVEKARTNLVLIGSSSRVETTSGMRRRSRGQSGGCAILQEQLIVSKTMRLVLDRLQLCLGANGFDAALSNSHADANRGLVSVGIAGATKRVQVVALPPMLTASGYQIPIRWEATGPTGELFPTLDANLTLQPASERGTRLTLTGSYTPPFGRVGAALDAALLLRVARATIHAFLTDLAAVTTEQSGTRPAGGAESAVE